MKTVILTSSGWLFPEVRNEIIAHLPRRRPFKILYIPTASMVVEDNQYAKRDVAIMHDLGFEVVTIDLAACRVDDLDCNLKKCQAIYVQGGNGFYLLKHARRTGFIDKVKKLVCKGSIVYIGKSAGSYLACPSIEMHTWHSNKWNRYGMEDLTAMSLVDFLVQAQYAESDNQNIIQGMTKAAHPIRLITNQQILVVKGNTVNVIGQRPEFKFENGDIIQKD